ncbi:penicillin-binding protein 2 [Candidatus Latescibacterota bacterium]
MLSDNSWDTNDKIVTRKPWVLIFVAFFLLTILGIRLFKLQVLDWRMYLEESDDKRIKREVIEAPRGYILDRNDVVLAENRLSYSITIDPFARTRFDETIPNLASYLGVSTPELTNTVKELTSKSRNPVKIARNVDFRLLSTVMEHNNDMPGVSCVFDQRRYYPQGTLASHVIGYMGETEKDQKSQLDAGYYYGQQVGVYGSEKYFEEQLKGKNGAKFVVRNYISRVIEDEDYKPDPLSPTPGQDVTLTLDVRLQIVAEEAFGDTVLGGLVALDPRNGEVLVMTSAPKFDPNEFEGVMSASRLSEIKNDPDKPMFNRAIQALYPPGSPFKVLTALAGLENGISETTKYSSCRGAYYFGRSYKCWKEGGHGQLDMVRAITNSCNVYFYQLGRKVGLEKWHTVASQLELGMKSGIDLDGEVEGVIPSHNFYQNVGTAWSPGMMLNLSIGQGEVVSTILQLARYTATIATEGLLTKPHLNTLGYEQPRQVADISKRSFILVKEGMKGVINSSEGTAKSARIAGHVIAGKTGTAQNPHGADHKLFIAFAPYDNPTIAIACVAENAGDYTGSLAVKIVKQVLIEYFNLYPDMTVASND